MVVSELVKASLCWAATLGHALIRGHNNQILVFNCFFFNPRTNTWAGVAPMAKEISALGVAELNGFLYAVGGWHRGRPLNTVLRWVEYSHCTPIMELKHQTFLIYELHGWPRRTGSGTRLAAKCKSWNKTTWKHHERWQNNSVENAFQRFALSFFFFVRTKTWFQTKNFYFCITNTLRRTQNLLLARTSLDL